MRKMSILQKWRKLSFIEEDFT